jgi:nucleoid DNA-binding protein
VNGKPDGADKITWDGLRRLIAGLIESPYGQPYYEADRALKAILEVLVTALRRGESVKIAGLGTFYLKHYTPHSHHNRYFWREGPISVMEPVKNFKRVFFTPSRDLIRSLNKEEPPCS